MDIRPLLVNLESPYKDFQGSEEIAREIVLAALCWPMEYWARLAIEWLAEGAPIDEKVIEALDAVAQHVEFSQSVRHKAFAIARRWSRANA
jgi:hypothetical protein